MTARSRLLLAVVTFVAFAALIDVANAKIEKKSEKQQSSLKKTPMKAEIPKAEESTPAKEQRSSPKESTITEETREAPTHPAPLSTQPPAQTSETKVPEASTKSIQRDSTNINFDITFFTGLLGRCNTALTALLPLEHPLWKAVKPHLELLKTGFLSVFYGPLVYLHEASLLPTTFWTEPHRCSFTWCCLTKLIRGANAKALERFNVSIGSFVGDLVLFFLAVGVLRRSPFLKRFIFSTASPASAQHSSWVKLLVLSSLPTGVFSIGGLVAAASGATAQVFVPAVFLGKLLQPYVTVVVLWGLRALYQCDCVCKDVVAPIVAFLSAPKSGVSQSATVDQVACIAGTLAVAVFIVGIVFPSQEASLDDEEEADG